MESEPLDIEKKCLERAHAFSSFLTPRVVHKLVAARTSTRAHVSLLSRAQMRPVTLHFWQVSFLLV